MKRIYLLVILFLCSVCVIDVSALEPSKNTIEPVDSQANIAILSERDSIISSFRIDSVVFFDSHSVAVLQVKETSSQQQITIVGRFPQFGAIEISKMVGQVYNMQLRKVHSFKDEMNPRVISYTVIANDENGPLFFKVDELANKEIYHLQRIEGISTDSSNLPNQLILHSLEEMYYAAVDAFLTIGKNHHFIAKDVPLYVSSEHFYTPFRMFIEKRELPEGMEFCGDRDLKKKISMKHPYVYCWYFGTQVNDDTITIWAWTPSFRKKGLHLRGSFCTYYWAVFQYKDNGWVLLNANVSQI